MRDGIHGGMGHAVALGDRPMGLPCFEQRDYLENKAIGQLASSIVTVLFALGGPSAIPWLVVAVIVDPVNVEPFWTRAHVLQECREAVAPAGADLNPPAAI